MKDIINYELTIDPWQEYFTKIRNTSGAQLSGRLLHYATFLWAYGYKVQLKKNSENIVADCRLRTPVAQNKAASDVTLNSEIN